MIPVQGTQVWSLIRELGSHIPCSQKKKKEKSIEYRKYRVQKSVVHHDKEIIQYTD